MCVCVCVRVCVHAYRHSCLGYVYQAWEGVWFTWKGHSEGWGRLAFDLGALLRELVQIIMLIMHGIMQIERLCGGQRLFVIPPRPPPTKYLCLQAFPAASRVLFPNPPPLRSPGSFSCRQHPYSVPGRAL